jgi:toxin FitB
MILLDTNVISEFIRTAPDAKVLRWCRQVSPSQIATTTVTLAEIEIGIQCMPVGIRQHSLRQRFDAFLASSVGTRVFSFDRSAVPHFGVIGSIRRANGRASATADLMIAAIAANHGFSVCTRNIADFEFCGVPLLNPWE